MLCSRLGNIKRAQFRNLKTTAFTRSPTTDVLTLAAAAVTFCVWSCAVCSALSLSHLARAVSVWACHFPLPLLLLLSFPPRPRRPRACLLEAGPRGGWGGGVYMVGAALRCPHHWLLWNHRRVCQDCVANDNKVKKIDQNISDLTAYSKLFVLY